MLTSGVREDGELATRVTPPGRGLPRHVHRRSWHSRRLVLLALAVLVAAIVLPLVLISPSRRVGPKGVPGNWQLVFDATFSSSTLDSSLWKTCYDDGTCRIPTNPEYEWYLPSQDKIVGHDLVLSATKRAAHGQPYTSGMIQSNGRFDFLYGDISIRAKVPAGYGTWPALWLIPADGQWPPEIDLMESWGSRPDVIRESVFTPDDVSGIHHNVFVKGLSAGFHTFSVDWEPGVISWYVDGHLEFQDHVSVSQPMYPVANLAVSAPPGPRSARTFPASFEISSIKVFQHPGVGTVLCRDGCTSG